MKVWLIQDGEPLPGIDSGTRDWRCGILAKMLVGRGHEVLWWASTFDHALKRHRFSSPKTITLQPGLDIRLLHGPGYGSNRSPKRLLHQRILARAFARESLSLHKPDLILVSLPTLEFVEKSINYGLANNVKVLIDVRDLWPDLYLTMFPSSLRRIMRIILEPEYRRAKRSLRQANGIIAVSETYFDWAIKLSGRLRQPTDVIFPLGYEKCSVNEEDPNIWLKLRCLSPIQTDKFIITFVGSFGTSYDLTTVIRAAQELRTKHVEQNVEIVIAGSGDQDLDLRNMAGKTSNIVFTGWLKQPSLISLLRLSSVGLCAYRGDALQSLPNKAFEYMSEGLPLLSSLPGELETLIHQKQIGLQYEAGNVESLVKQILWFATHPDERKAMGNRARQLFAERFSADTIYPRFIAHMEKVASGSI
jgi:glycosyltransferase involved in cell wall biosynthesis